MKLYHLITGMSVLAIATLTSCGSSGSSSDNCRIFGEVPGIYADYQAQRDKIEDSAKKSESDYKKASARLDELKEQYRTKIEEAGKKLDGQPIEIVSGEDLNIVSPLSLSFKEFANGVNSVFNVNGEVEAAKDVTIEVTESWLKSHNVEYLYVPLLIVGYDEQGAEVTKDRIGCFKGFTVVGGKVVLPSGTKAELQTVAYNKNKYDDYIKVRAVKLALDT
ncbi:MAG: hypothetical protein K2K52_00450, partial [Paramuribaculum sp.]|nr:hypothetical protein [Paramuribaculum sp.]